MRVVFVHGACVKDGSWWWHRTGELLAERGVASEAPVLPSCGETGEPTDAQGPGLAEDVASVRQVLAASDEPTVVVAHSYGGIVLHDIITIEHARKALAKGADGLIAVCAGAGGHAGGLSPFALVQEIRQFFDGPFLLSGAIANALNAVRGYL